MGLSRTEFLRRALERAQLEVGFSARSAADHRALFDEPPLASMPVEHLTPRIEERSLDVQRLLADRAQHRAPAIPDLFIAATASSPSSRGFTSTTTST